MKETIKYYYNIDVDNIDELDGRYHFVFNKKHYFFVFYNRLPEELEDIILCSKYMKEKNIDCHDIILNRDGQVLTKINDFNYILLGVNNLNDEFNILDISFLNKKIILNDRAGSLYRNNWSKLWSDKVDYFEYQIRELGLNKPVISDTFSYYLGLAENAIAYANSTNKNLQRTNNDNIVLSHRRIFYPNIKLNYLNPLSFVYDLEVRDPAEYIKAMFFVENEDEVMIELESYLKASKLSTYGYQMFFARLLYPSYYFDVYEQIMNNNKDEDSLVPIVSKVDDYEIFLKKAYLEISKYAPIEKIDWIID